MSKTLKIRMTCTIVDEQGVEADCNTYGLVDPTRDFYDVISAFYAWLAALDAVTAGRIVRSLFVVYPDLGSVKSEPLTGSRVSQTGLLAFTGPSTARRDSAAVPAVDSSLLSDGKLITDSGAIASLISFLSSGGSSLEVTTSDWDGPVTFKDSSLTFREYNAQLEPKTFVLA